MRKLLSTILAVLLLLPTVAFASSTDSRGAFEFCELFSQRFTEYVKDDELDYDLYIQKGFVSPFAPVGTIMIDVAAGLMYINEDDFTVHQLVMTLFDENASDEKNVENSLICVMAMSALEYDYTDNNIFAQKAKAFGGPASGAEAAIDVWNNNIIPTTTEKMLQQIIETKKRVLIYSGNYHYYLSYFSDEYNGEKLSYFMLTAEEYE